MNSLMKDKPLWLRLIVDAVMLAVAAILWYQVSGHV